MEDYDVISGLSGICAYLLNFHKDIKIRKCIEDILHYLISITQYKITNSKKVPMWHITSDNQYSEENKKKYACGSFNFSFSHGISGVLAAMSLCASKGIIIDNQINAMKNIEDILMNHLAVYNKKMLWPGIMSFEDFVSNKSNFNNTRASWCYGTPGIARAMYLSSKFTNNTLCRDISTRAMHNVCNMGKDELYLSSPIICHGYAGLIDVLYCMYINTSDTYYWNNIQNYCNAMMEYVDNTYKYYFKCGIDNMEMNFLQGSTGILLSMLLICKKNNPIWLRKLCII